MKMRGNNRIKFLSNLDNTHSLQPRPKALEKEVARVCKMKSDLSASLGYLTSIKKKLEQMDKNRNK